MKRKINSNEEKSATISAEKTFAVPRPTLPYLLTCIIELVSPVSRK
jgi:hypothetical protein